jgi:hypothetical protein
MRGGGGQRVKTGGDAVVMVAVRGHGGAGDRVKEGYLWRGRPLGVSPRHGGERRHSAWRKEEEGGGGVGWLGRTRPCRPVGQRVEWAKNEITNFFGIFIEFWNLSRL